MGSPRENFKALLKASGQSITKARLQVFEALLGQEPLTMHGLVGRAGQVDRASVYRAVDLFERLGIVQRLNTGWKYKLELSDKFAEHHHHLTCVRCGRTVAMNEGELEALIGRLAAEHHFLPTAHQIEIQGLCAECQKLAG
ncbi:MAG TPA: Fur family transcriptional regulator [Candidatus Saccharimonadales bacterium]|nr:Fur family transcriptional regulator [Candidatus Saccharimonadales bacterium]